MGRESVKFFSFMLYFTDVQFLEFMKEMTDLPKDKIYTVFDMLDVGRSGETELEEFYLLCGMLVAPKVMPEVGHTYTPT